MTFVITIAQRKGGAGKTTLACQLAAMLLADNFRVAALDLDEQKSFSHWAALRRQRIDENAAFTLETATSYGLSSALRRAQGADVAIIDTPPAVDPAVERAIRAADLVLIPLQLSPFDLTASLPTARAIGQAGRPFLFVINRAPPRARIADEIRTQIKKHRLPVAKAEFGARAAFAESIAAGAGVVETAPSSPAAAEVRDLAREVMKRAGIGVAAVSGPPISCASRSG